MSTLDKIGVTGTILLILTMISFASYDAGYVRGRQAGILEEKKDRCKFSGHVWVEEQCLKIEKGE